MADSRRRGDFLTRGQEKEWHKEGDDFYSGKADGANMS